MCKIEERKLNLLMDLYQLTMSQGYFNEGLKENKVAFDMFFRKVPDKGGYAICAGLQQVIEPRIKISENVEKVTNPGHKSVWRLYDSQ